MTESEQNPRMQEIHCRGLLIRSFVMIDMIKAVTLIALGVTLSGCLKNRHMGDALANDSVLSKPQWFCGYRGLDDKLSPVVDHDLRWGFVNAESKLVIAARFVATGNGCYHWSEGYLWVEKAECDCTEQIPSDTPIKRCGGFINAQGEFATEECMYVPESVVNGGDVAGEGRPEFRGGNKWA